MIQYDVGCRRRGYTLGPSLSLIIYTQIEKETDLSHVDFLVSPILFQVGRIRYL